MYHKSIFNYIYKRSKNNWVIYNTFSGSIILIDEKLKKKFDSLKDGKIENDDDDINNLINQGILVDNNHDEKKLVDASRTRRAFGEKSAYLRILTTTSCNARCPYCYEKGFLSENDAINLKFKGGQCYTCHQGSYVVAPNGELYKCTVTIKDKSATVGNIFDGIDRNNYYFKWVNPELPEKCNKCVFLQLCQGGCRA